MQTGHASMAVLLVREGCDSLRGGKVEHFVVARKPHM